MEEVEKFVDSYEYQASIDVPPEAAETTCTEVQVTEGDSEDITVKAEEPVVMVDPVVIEKLATKVLGLFLPNLQKAKRSLNEVHHNQEVLLETLVQENAKLNEVVAKTKLIETMQQTKLYHAKLVNLKKEINMLNDKSTKLKERAINVHQLKQKKIDALASQREKELEKELRLTAKPVSTLPVPPSPSLPSRPSISSSPS